MSGHTPGPWEIGQNATYVVKRELRRKPILLVRCVWTPSQAANSTAPTPEDAYANARLIAAAPELLEAARNAAREWRLHGSLTDSARLLEAAIAKAEGR